MNRKINERAQDEEDEDDISSISQQSDEDGHSQVNDDKEDESFETDYPDLKSKGLKVIPKRKEVIPIQTKEKENLAPQRPLTA